MKYLDLTLPSPAENLAGDEVLLDLCEEGRGEILRFWEARQHFIALGYANKAAAEVNLPACAAEGVPVLRRCSGGGTVLQGPGCLNYSLALRCDDTGPLATITGANRFIMQRHCAALAKLTGTDIRVAGHTDLACGQLKFSGNAQRRRRRALLFHGTLLHAFDLTLIERLLRFPTLQPDYRRGRSHAEFVANLNATPAALKAALRECWQADAASADVPTETIAALVRAKYSQAEWNLKF